jgi:hypothetical protein
VGQDLEFGSKIRLSYFFETKQGLFFLVLEINLFIMLQGFFKPYTNLGLKKITNFIVTYEE